MSTKTKNSMAAVMSVVVTIVTWLALIALVIGTVLLAVGLVTSFSGGAIALPGGRSTGDVTPGMFGISLIGWVLVTGGIAYIGLLLRRILMTLAEGEPFVAENASRLTRVALALGIIQLASYVLTICLNMFGGQKQALSIDLAVWGAIVILLILSQVFREGTRLRDEEKMTI